MCNVERFTDPEHSLEPHPLAVFPDGEHIPLRLCETQAVLLNAGSAELALNGQHFQAPRFHVVLHFCLILTRLHQLIEGTAAVVLVFIIVAGDVEAVLVDPDMGISKDRH